MTGHRAAEVPSERWHTRCMYVGGALAVLLNLIPDVLLASLVAPPTCYLIAAALGALMGYLGVRAGDAYAHRNPR